MKQKGDELIVMSKKMFFLILASLSITGILIGFAIGYMTVPIKEVNIKKIEESDKTVLPATVETALAKKQEPLSEQKELQKEQFSQTKIEERKSEGTEIQIVKKEEPKQAQQKDPLQKIQEVGEKDDKKVQDTEKNMDKSLKNKKLAKNLTYSYYTIQIGAFSEVSNARALMEKAKKTGYKVTLLKEDIYKVRIGRYLKFSQTKKISDELKSKGFENFILKIKETTRGGRT